MESLAAGESTPEKIGSSSIARVAVPERVVGLPSSDQGCSGPGPCRKLLADFAQRGSGSAPRGSATVQPAQQTRSEGYASVYPNGLPPGSVRPLRPARCGPEVRDSATHVAAVPRLHAMPPTPSTTLLPVRDAKVPARDRRGVLFSPAKVHGRKAHRAPTRQKPAGTGKDQRGCPLGHPLPGGAGGQVWNQVVDLRLAKASLRA